jgi:hypothetical protein
MWRQFATVFCYLCRANIVAGDFASQEGSWIDLFCMRTTGPGPAGRLGS